MSYVTTNDFAARYENTVAVGDTQRLRVLIDDACDIAADITGTTYADGETVPGAIVATICSAVRRAYENPTGLQSETIGDYSYRAFEGGGSGVYFTAAEEKALRRAVGVSSAGSVELEGMLPATQAAEYLPVNGGEPVHYFAAEDLW